jgi:cobalt-zinc-cadmium efflux system outer membrane protein
MTRRLAGQSQGQVRGNQAWAGYVETWFLTIVIMVLGFLSPGAALAATGEGSVENQKSTVLRLSLDEALAIFLHQNQDLLIAKYGIETAKARKITAGLFPNPEFSIAGFSAFTQKCTFSDCRGILPEISQLLEVAGKRGFRIESAELGTQSAEASFEDTLRQLSFAVKDTYYRVQVERRHLEVDKKRRDRLKRFLEKMTGDSLEKENLEDVIRLQIQQIRAEAWVINDIQNIETANSEFRILLRLPPETEPDLTTELRFHRVDPDIASLRNHLTENRPDIRAKRLLYSQRRSELKLAHAMQYPDVTVGVGFMMQGPTGPDNQQQWTATLGVPLPVFDRNQGGMLEAATSVQMAETALQQTLNNVHNEVSTAYRRLLHSRLLVETYGASALDAAESLFNTVEQRYKDGKTTNLYFLDAARTANDIQEAYLDALYNYQRNILLLESAAGQTIS